MVMPKSASIFRRTGSLIGEIDEFMDNLAQSSLAFKRAVEIFLTDGRSDEFEDKRNQVNSLESSSDDLRRNIERQLYTQTLIPESRGDVLGLLENLDSVLNNFEGSLWGFSIENPNIPEVYHGDYRALTEQATAAVEALVLASRAFFRSAESVGDHMHKVMFYEKEADKVSTKLKRRIFDSDIDLARKLHMRHFVELIDNIADRSEDVADRLAIYAIKRRF